VLVPGVVVAVNTVAAPSIQVIVVPAWEQVVACACALAGRIKIPTAAETLLSNARRTVEFVNSVLPISDGAA
jgi:hypothetical protein